MYRVNIPINCDKFDRTRDKQLILEELKALDADRVMLNFETAIDGHVLLYDQKDYQQQIDRMKEACTFFKQHGFEVGAWFWGLQFDEPFPFTTIKTLKGKNAHRFACPTDTSFLKNFQQCLIDVAKTGVDMILLNDDLRFGAWGSFGCLCKNHVRMICNELGEQLSEEQLAQRILDGGKNKYRDAFLRANRQSLENYAIQMRKAVDTVNPKIRLGFCACMSSWDIDGDAFTLAKLFAGNTRPMLRLIGAPYWSADKSKKNRLQNIVELERMEASWNPYPEIELIAEGDVYPRPRLNCAANYLEGFDTALRASGALDGILRICIDYVSNAGYESGYRKKYLKNKQLYADIEKHFAGKKHTGIRVYETKNKVAVIPNPNALGKECDMEEVFYSAAARVLATNTIPTVYEGPGVTGIAFGENAYELGEECLANGLIIDALAAKILTDRGIDVGMTHIGEEIPIKYQYLPDDDNYILALNRSILDVQLNPTAEIISYAVKKSERPTLPFCYRYQNGKGQKFLVFNCDGRNNETHLKSYANQKIIADQAEWLSGNKLPAVCHGNPNLYMQCKEDETSTVIGLWNFFEDEALDPVIHLGRSYRDAEFFGGSGTLCSDTLQLSDIPPFGFCGIVLTKALEKKD